MKKALAWLLDSKRPVYLLAGLLALMLLMSLLQGGETSAQTAQEKRLCEVLSQIEGAGRVQAVLFYQEEAQSAWGSAKSVVTGAVVVADGAKDLTVKLALIRAVRTLLGLPEQAVDVFAMEGSR